ncbi:helix-turn-helix transcriptional regulator [Sulfuriferula sp.]|uniref:helix-turn-helix transcriptional regulator n=1 Tax=Sulfuriferula sp. TaxID=2025307 RepID=UPI00272F4166|nr:helix-turn-helix transcriptional regulator [Sulfuriferula sp.]MDP2027069.1 helix-turn-helix transcriptional regulator [Sulfuriferula sp.]
MKQATAVSYIRQLCCLGLGGQIIMPELLRALHAFVPSSFNMFLWADENYQVSNMYSENSELYSRQLLYLREFYNSKEVQAYKTTFSEAMRTGRGWRNSERLGREFLASDIFNNLLQPCGIRHTVEVTIWESGRGLGSVVLNRAPGEKPFSDEEEMRLRGLIPYIAHGLRGTRDLRGEPTPSGESGTLIVDNHDKIVQSCPEGRRLLLLAAHTGFSRYKAPTLDSSALKRLCANLRGNLRGQSQPVPMQRQRNAWGEFVLRAYPLSTGGEPDGSIAVVIERHEPMPITLMRTMRALPVTARQREVCLLLSYGYTHSMIGQRMHVSKHTATDYVRKIYDKLDVRSQDQLMKKLMNIHAH